MVQGALTTIHAATDPEVQGGTYFASCKKAKQVRQRWWWLLVVLVLGWGSCNDSPDLLTPACLLLVSNSWLVYC